ncbi:hypothetical protein ITI46_07900 [Streptomyces oryzae]|uniref:Uncharacterized protein n=1 Tax=Streptomyces oryzae TaxID=1434886 RepID=A0ABS3X8C5_9ACTN|nr:hypothetical protein [Streptomyces oryzae]MBO8191611.1 hypothetical protein [Streptomyces oryzae]
MAFDDAVNVSPVPGPQVTFEGDVPEVAFKGEGLQAAGRAMSQSVVVRGVRVGVGGEWRWDAG